jgi:hypothetical protein
VCPAALAGTRRAAGQDPVRNARGSVSEPTDCKGSEEIDVGKTFFNILNFKSTWETARYLDVNAEVIAATIDDRHAKAGGFYIGHAHGLIHRHIERISIGEGHDARWNLTVDLELPSDPDAHCGVHEGKCLFLFPLVFLKKAEGRTGFGVRDESGSELPLPTRTTCDWMSAAASTHAAKRIVKKLRASAREAGKRRPSQLPLESLDYVLHCVAQQRPYDAAVILNELLHSVDPAVRDAWKEEGLTSDLKMLVEHWLLWLPVRGLPGERRQLVVGQDVELLPRPFFRVRVGEVKKPAGKEREGARLDTGKVTYGKIGRRVDFSVLGERLASPLAWMPIDFDFPTIYTRRCSSYHFELVCPKGLSPRGIKLATDRHGLDGAVPELDGGETLGTKAGRVYLPGGRSIGDLTVRATVGIGKGAFPILWLLMGAITSIMLWSLVAAHPLDLIVEESHSKNEILGGILLAVPALLGAVALGFEGSLTRLIGGARLLLVATGLAAAAAAAVLIGEEPLKLEFVTQWAICASIATAATVPLATSWLLSLPLVWRQLQKLKEIRTQYRWFGAIVAAAIGMVLTLYLVENTPLLQGILAVGLLLMTVPLSLLASNRLPVPIVTNRRFLSLGTIFAAFVCLILGCLELHTALLHGDNDHRVAEVVSIGLLLFSLLVGRILSFFTSFFAEKKGEVHVASNEAEQLLTGKRIRELIQLRPPDEPDSGRQSAPATVLDDPYSAMRIDRPVREEEMENTEGNWSWGVRSTVYLPGYSASEFTQLLQLWPREEDAGVRRELELDTKRRLIAHMAAIKESNPCA